jgi:hypothetical protein
MIIHLLTLNPRRNHEDVAVIILGSEPSAPKVLNHEAPILMSTLKW